MKERLPNKAEALVTAWEVRCVKHGLVDQSGNVGSAKLLAIQHKQEEGCKRVSIKNIAITFSEYMEKFYPDPGMFDNLK